MGFIKNNFSEDFIKEEESKISKIFSDLGFNKIDIETCFTNGKSHYVRLSAKVLDAGKLYMDMWSYDNETSVKVRISDHSSGLERNSGGVEGNTMTLNAFKKLIQTGAISQ